MINSITTYNLENDTKSQLDNQCPIYETQELVEIIHESCSLLREISDKFKTLSDAQRQILLEASHEIDGSILGQ